MAQRVIPNILSIAGSDPSGGAGIQADLKTFAAQGCYGMAALTALTAQNTQGVQDVQLIDPKFVAAQIESVFADVRVDAVKIGMIATAPIAEAVADVLERCQARNIVLDPVMVAKGGDRLLMEDAIETLRNRLLPLADIVTPNIPEAAVLLNASEATDQHQMAEQAAQIKALGPRAVLVKGGHLSGERSPDCLLADGNAPAWFDAPRTVTKNTHGTGCTLSAALAAQLGHGASMEAAVTDAKAYLSGAIATADALQVGSGHGPVNHFSALWSR